jgi:hypothetical protein
MTIPGIGPITATALVAVIGDVGVLKNGRQFAAWLILQGTCRMHHLVAYSYRPKKPSLGLRRDSLLPILVV